MSDTTFRAASPATYERTTTSSLPVTSGALACRYRAREVLWGHRKRFVVFDAATNATVAIRTNRLVADGDLLRLNLAVRGRPHPRTPPPPVPNGSPSELIPEYPSRRQCGRCRQFFASDPAATPGAIHEWWLCEPCHHSLIGTGRPFARTGPVDSVTSSSSSSTSAGTTRSARGPSGVG